MASEDAPAGFATPAAVTGSVVHGPGRAPAMGSKTEADADAQATADTPAHAHAHAPVARHADGDARVAQQRIAGVAYLGLGGRRGAAVDGGAARGVAVGAGGAQALVGGRHARTSAEREDENDTTEVAHRGSPHGLPSAPCVEMLLVRALGNTAAAARR